MQAVLDRRDSVVVLPTGGGKSLCFQAPALVEPEGAAPRGFALVVSPLISLMKDQVDGLRVDGVAAAYLNSTQSPDERDAVVAGLRAGRWRLLYVSPERLVGEGSQGFRRLLLQCGVRYIAVDEAHCISQWGHDFRPEYRQLALLRADFPQVSLHAFTATATERVRRDIVSELRLDNPAVLVGSFDRPNLTYRVLRRDNLHRQLLQILGATRGRSRHHLLLIAARGRIARRMAEGGGAQAVPYHAGLPDDDAQPASGGRSSTNAPTSSSRRSRSAWASIDRTSASSSTPRAAVAGALPAGIRARRTRRIARRVCVDLLGRRISSAGGRCSKPTGS